MDPPGDDENGPPANRRRSLLTMYSTTVIDPTQSDAEAIRRRLSRAHEAGRQFKQRVRMPMFLIGGGLLVLSLALAISLYASVRYLRYFPACMLGVGPGLVMLLTSLLPTDRRLVRFALYQAVFICVLLVAFIGSIVAIDIIYLLERRIDRYTCRLPGLGPIPCWFAYVNLVGKLLLVLISVTGGVVSAVMLSRRMPTRKRLDRLWSVSGVMVASIGVTLLAMSACGLAAGVFAALLNRGRGGRGAWGEATVIWVTVAAMGVECTLLGLWVSHGEARMRAQAWLASRGEEVAAAAGIAAMLGSQPPSEVHRIAQQRFRAVSLELVRFEHLESPEPNPGLYKLARPADFSHVDAFISHSWSDPPALKWAELQRWRRQFKYEHAREPTVWIDRICLDQLNIEENLLCLPVYLAACNELLVLCGKTYLSRLWCVVEVFTFIEMTGGESRPITLRPFGSGPNDDRAHDETRWREQCASFDARNATCLLPRDREKLLATIELGFGGFDRFNSEMRRLLLSVTDGFQASGPGSFKQLPASQREGGVTINGDSTRRRGSLSIGLGLGWPWAAAISDNSSSRV